MYIDVLGSLFVLLSFNLSLSPEKWDRRRTDTATPGYPTWQSELIPRHRATPHGRANWYRDTGLPHMAEPHHVREIMVELYWLLHRCFRKWLIFLHAINYRGKIIVALSRPPPPPLGTHTWHTQCLPGDSYYLKAFFKSINRSQPAVFFSWFKVGLEEVVGLWAETSHFLTRCCQVSFPVFPCQPLDDLSMGRGTIDDHLLAPSWISVSRGYHSYEDPMSDLMRPQSDLTVTNS